MAQHEFDDVSMNSLGGVRQSTTPVNDHFGDGQFKMADFLLDLRYVSKRLLCPSSPDTCVYKISFVYVEVHGGALPLKTVRWRYRAILPRPYPKPIKYVNFHQA